MENTLIRLKKILNTFTDKELEEYEHKGNIELCKEGFHFCKSIIDVKDYYDITDENL